MLNMSKLPVSVDLSKLISLPNSSRWRVAEFERVVDGAIPIRTRQMGWLFDSVREWKLRPCSLTRHGILLVYIRRDKGFVLDMARALAIDLKTDVVHVHGQAYAADSSNGSLLLTRPSRFHDDSPHKRVVAASATQTEEMPFADCETPSYSAAASPEWPTTDVCDDHNEISPMSNLLIVRQSPVAVAPEKNSALFTRSSSVSSFPAQLPVIEEEAPSPGDSDPFTWTEDKQSDVLSLPALKKKARYASQLDRTRPRIVAIPRTPKPPSFPPVYVATATAQLTLTKEKQSDALPLPAPTVIVKKKTRYASQLDRTYSQRHSSLPVPLLCEQLEEHVCAIEAAKYKRRPRIVAISRPPKPPSFPPVYVATATKMISDYPEMPAISMIEDQDGWSNI